MHTHYVIYLYICTTTLKYQIYSKNFWKQILNEGLEAEVECLPNKHKALSSNPSITKKKKKI
jgi:hypothetical protein